MVEHTGDDPGRASSATNTTASKRAAAGESASRSEAANGSGATRRAAGSGASRKRRYLIAVRPGPGFAPMSADAIHDTLKGMDDVEILRRVRPKGLRGLGAGAHPGAQEIIVARMDDERAQSLRLSAPAHVVIEPDSVLVTGEATITAHSHLWSFGGTRHPDAAPAPRS